MDFGQNVWTLYFGEIQVWDWFSYFGLLNFSHSDQQLPTLGLKKTSLQKRAKTAKQLHSEDGLDFGFEGSQANKVGQHCFTVE